MNCPCCDKPLSNESLGKLTHVWCDNRECRSKKAYDGRLDTGTVSAIEKRLIKDLLWFPDWTQ
jgi:hypothetical protein